MVDVEADSLNELVQKLPEHFGTDVKQFLAGDSDDDTGSLIRESFN